MKTRHRHIIEATIICAMPFDPADLAEAVIIQKQFQGVASTMVGFRSVTTRMTKEPVPEEVKPVTESDKQSAMQAAANSSQDGLDIPPFMKK